VKEPDMDDYKKLTRVMQYISNTTKLTINIKGTTIPYSVHLNMKSHSEIFITLGKGATCTASCNRK